MKKLLFLLLTILITITISSNNVPPGKSERTITFLRLHEIRNTEFSKQNLLDYLTIKYPNYNEIMLRQFALETGWFKSNLFLVGNNIAGMKKAKIRATNATGTYKGHATYLHWTDSVDDYFLWLDYFTEKGHDTNQYYSFLENIGYAESGAYVDTLQRININRYYT